MPGSVEPGLLFTLYRADWVEQLSRTLDYSRQEMVICKLSCLRDKQSRTML